MLRHAAFFVVSKSYGDRISLPFIQVPANIGHKARRLTLQVGYLIEESLWVESRSLRRYKDKGEAVKPLLIS